MSYQTSNRELHWLVEEPDEAVQNIATLSVLGSKELAYQRVQASLNASLQESEQQGTQK